VARDEHQPEQVVLHLAAVQRGGEVGRPAEHVGLLPGVQFVPELAEVVAQSLVTAQPVDGPVPARAHQPGPRVGRDARPWPLAERGHQRVLGQVFG
jgi:hypothetical protein